MSPNDDHDDFGGLHRDLIATGAAIGRRQLLRMAARYGVAVGALQPNICNAPTATPYLAAMRSSCRRPIAAPVAIRSRCRPPKSSWSSFGDMIAYTRKSASTRILGIAYSARSALA